jgi:hypothetical protein
MRRLRGKLVPEPLEHPLHGPFAAGDLGAHSRAASG